MPTSPSLFSKRLGTPLRNGVPKIEKTSYCLRFRWRKAVPNEGAFALSMTARRLGLQRAPNAAPDLSAPSEAHSHENNTSVSNRGSPSRDDGKPHDFPLGAGGSKPAQ